MMKKEYGLNRHLLCGELYVEFIRSFIIDDDQYPRYDKKSFILWF